MLLLDTLRPGKASGELCERRLAWLAKQLAARNDAVCIAMHHPPLAVGIEYMDGIGLAEPRRFWEVVAPHRERVRHGAKARGRHTARRPLAQKPREQNGEIIAGLEPPESSIRAIDWVTSVGAIPTVCVFRPLAGTDYAHLPPPEPESLVPVFARLYDACMTHGLPIGCAPNIHVSLVMLPEECAAFSTARYPWQAMKLSAIKAALGWYLKIGRAHV